MTGLKLKTTTIKVGGLNLQATPEEPKPPIIVTPVKPKLPIIAKSPSPNPPIIMTPVNIKPPIVATPAKPFLVPIKIVKPIKPFNNKKVVIKPIGDFDPVELAGITKERPEILIMTDFLPVFMRNSLELSSAGKMLDIQLAARNLKIENFVRLKQQLDRNNKTSPFIDDLNDRWKQQVKKAKIDAQFLSSMMSVMRRTKAALNVRNLRPHFGARTFKEFFVDELQFTEDGINSFSNSKLFAQLLFDMKIAASIYSPGLFDAEDQDRKGDQDAIEIDKTVNLSDGKFVFDIEDFRSSANLVNMADTREHTDLVSSLPKNLNDRIKLLLMVLSKEVRVSKGLQNTTILQPLKETFGGSNVGDPFVDIVGEPGDRITDVPLGNESLCRLVRFIGNDTTIVLPFEQKYITDEDDRTYVPGTSYFVDSVLQKDPKFDTSRLKKFRDKLETKVSDGAQIINGLLQLNANASPLRAETIYSDVLRDAKILLEDIADGNEKSGIVLGLFQIAKNDMELKSMLFQFVMLLGIKKPPIAVGGGRIRPPFDLVRTAELYSIKNFSSITTDPALLAPTTDNVLVSSALSQLADTIAHRLFLVVAQTSPKNPGGMALRLKRKDISENLLDAEGNKCIRSIVNLIATLEKDSKPDIDDESGRTRYKQLSITTRAALVFELYSALYVNYTHSSYYGVTTGVHIRAVTDYQKSKLSATIFKFAEDEVSRLANKPKISPPQNFADPNSEKTEDAFFPEAPTLQQILEKLGEFGGVYAVVLFGSLNSIALKLVAEDSLMRDFIGLMKAVSSRVKSSTDCIIQFFDLKGPNQKSLSEFVNEPDADEKASMLTEAQVNLALAEVDDMERDNRRATSRSVDPVDPLKPLKNELEEPVESKDGVTIVKVVNFQKIFLDDSDVHPRVRDAMFRLFIRSNYRDRLSTDLKILTVGIPSGFMENLRARIDVDDAEPDDFNPVETDVISIDVYKRDFELEDIVFKPQQFVFEMSRFVARGEFSRGTEDILDIPWSTQKNFSSLSGVYGKEGDISQDSVYDFLELVDRYELMDNHIISYLLGVYIKVMSGISTTEIDYLANEEITSDPFDNETRTVFTNLVNKHISGLAGKAITLDELAKKNPQIDTILKKMDNYENIQSAIDQINNVVIQDVEEAASIEITQDIIDFMSLFSPNSFISGASARRRKALSPKLFERIFNLPIDPNEFNVDVDATNRTKFGQGALKRLQIDKRTFVVLDKGRKEMRIDPRTTRDNSVVYDEFFVTISTVGGQLL